MTKCDNPDCGSDRVIVFQAKCADRCYTLYNGKEYDGQAPRIGDAEDISDAKGEYLQPDICLECGKVQGEFPKPEPDFSGV